MEVSPERIQEFKDIYKKEYGKELTDAEASEAANNLVNFFELLWDISIREAELKRRLKKEPKGFHLDGGGRNCGICHRMLTGDGNWYDGWGLKCLPCQRAVEQGIVPGFTAKYRDSFYLSWELKDKFNIHPQTARKMVRTGELKARIILDNGKPYEYVFLKKENPHYYSRYSPERKSYDRHREKEAREHARAWKEKMIEEK